jgi:hypothetical protein
MRVSTKRSWIKLYINNYIMGSVRYQLTPAERSVWVDLLCLAGLSPTAGSICDSDNRAYPHSFIANRFNIRTTLLEDTLNKCKEEGRIKEDSGGIHIINWGSYQSEYQRQKPYRDTNI